MEGNRKYVVVTGAPIPLSQITLDCDVPLCVPARKGDKLTTVLKRICDNRPVGAVAPVSVNWLDITDKPTFFSGDYNDLINKPTISGSGATSLYDQSLVGLKNGINRDFTTLQPYVLQTTRLYVNGQRMKRGYDYQEVSTTTIQLLFDVWPPDEFIIDFDIP